MQKIEDTKKSVDFLPDELKSCFEGVHDFTKCLTIEPSSVEFLQPYLKEEHLLNIIEQIPQIPQIPQIQQIPQNPPAVNRFTLDSSSILGNQEQKDQLNAAIREIVPNFKSFQLVYTSKDDAYDHETIFQKSRNHVITLLLVKSTTNKIMGGVIPIQFQNLNGNYS